MPDQALSQCDAYLRGMKGVAREAVSDTAGAAQAIATEGLRCVLASQPSLPACITGTCSNAVKQCRKASMSSGTRLISMGVFALGALRQQSPPLAIACLLDSWYPFPGVKVQTRTKERGGHPDNHVMALITSVSCCGRYARTAI